MNNWRLLLLAVVVVVQPLKSYTESNLIDGRECCERTESEDTRLYGYRKTEGRRLLDGNREDRRTNEHRLRTLDGFREERRYDETIRGPMLTSSESLERSERRNSPELSRSTKDRLVRGQERRHRDTFSRTREIHEEQNRNRDESRNIRAQNERDSRESRNRDTLDDTRTVRLLRDGRDTRSVERESRNTMSRLQVRAIRSHEERRFTKNRETNIPKREREDVTRSDTRAPTQYDSRIQVDDNRERRAFDRRNQDDSTDFVRARLSDARISEIRVQRTVEQNERNNRDSRDVRVELRRSQRDTELREIVSSVRRDSERTSADRMRESRDKNSRLVQNRMDTRNNQRTDERKPQGDESRRDTLRNTEERRFDSRQTRASRTLDIATMNDERMERRSLSMDRLLMFRESRDRTLSRSSERNTRDERAARIRDVSDVSSDGHLQRDTNRISRDRSEPRQDVRRITSGFGIRESSDERQREVSRISRHRTISVIREVRDTERTPESTNIREYSEDRRPQRDESRLSRNRISPLSEERDISERESHEHARISSERRQRDTNLFSKDRTARDTERAQETRRIVRPSRTQMNFRKLVFGSRQDVRDIKRSDLRRQVLERSVEKARMTRSISVERRNDAHKISRASRSTEASRIREDTRINERDERQQTRDQGTMKQRVTLSVAAPLRLQLIRRSSRTESIQLEQLISDRAQVRENEREMKRENRDVDRTRILLNRRSSGSVLAERRQSAKDAREVRMTRIRSEIRSDRVLAVRRQENRDSRNNRGEVRSERVLAERRQENRDSRNIRGVVRSERVLVERRQENDDSQNNRNEVRCERVLTERRQENRDSRNNRDEIRSERVLAERIKENRDSQNNGGEVWSEKVLAERRQVNHEASRDSLSNRGEVRSDRVIALRNLVRELRMGDKLDTRWQRDASKDSRERSMQHESRDVTERLIEASRDSVVRNERERSNEKEVQSDRISTRRESTNGIRANNILTMERARKTDNRFANAGKLEETPFRNNAAVTYRDALIQESDETVFSNWQMVFYTLQGVYLCGLLVQMLTENSNKKRTFNWWSSSKNLIKVD